MRTDTERLDWLEANGPDIQADIAPDGLDWWVLVEDPSMDAGPCPTLREAIDAAMDATTEPEEEG